MAVFWGLSQIGQLPNPDPSDMEQWDPNFKHQKDVSIDRDFESSRGETRRQAQEWAGLEVDPEAELFVFVGRWSQQKGVDLIADIFPNILEEYPKTQLICIGPTIDLYGKFAALKLAKLMEQYPKRVFSKPQFTQLPPYIFSGAEFALIPSRDEPFGLVAVEFGRKGALGVGARVGGLGQMPGWWYTIESNSTTHLLSQFKQAITAALESKTEVRAKMRAWSAKQRFPVAQWLEGLEKLQGRSIKMHKKISARSKRNLNLSINGPKDRGRSPSRNLTPGVTPNLTPNTSMFFPSRPTSPSTGWPLPAPQGTSSRPMTPDAGGVPHRSFLNPGSNSPGFNIPMRPRRPDDDDAFSVYSDVSTLAPPRFLGESEFSPLPSPLPRTASGLGLGGMHRYGRSTASVCSVVSVDSIVGNRTDFRLQQVDPFFTDSDGRFYEAFEKQLGKLSSKNSISQLCIEEYLVDSEREFFDELRDAKLGTGTHSRAASTANLVVKKRPDGLPRTNNGDWSVTDDVVFGEPANNEKAKREQFGLAEDYVPPTGLKK